MFEDEKIISQRNDEVRKRYHDIFTGIFVGKQFYQFHETVLFEKKIRIYLPDEFVDMPSDMLKKKYPSEQRPQIVRTNQTGTVNVTFSFIDDDVSDERLPNILSGFIVTIRRLYPGTLFLEKGVEESEVRCHWMEFRSSALDGDVYNLFFLSAISGKLLMGTFNCPMINGADWKPYVIQIMSTIRELEKEEVCQDTI